MVTPGYRWSFFGAFQAAGLGASLNQTQFEVLYGSGDPGNRRQRRALRENHGRHGGLAGVSSASSSAGAPLVPLSAYGGCLVALSGGPGYGRGNVSVSYDGQTWLTHPVPFASRSAAGVTRSPPTRPPRRSRPW
jgi:hypothetical protein